MRIVFIFLFFLIPASDKIVIDRAEAKKAFLLINKIRENPAAYFKDYKISDNFKVTGNTLRWNDTLARVAEEKAKDMAARNYFDHVDPNGFGINYYINKSGYKLNPAWVKNKDDNYFESIVAGIVDGEDAVRQLIIDEGIPSVGHRKHLLGNGHWTYTLLDIGIGFDRID